MVGKRILIAGGDTRSQSGMSKFFIRQHYFIIRAASANDVIAKVEYTLPDVIILDIETLSSGLNLCARIRNVTDVPIILLDNEDDTEKKIQALDMGADAYFVKPINHVVLLARIKALLRRCGWQFQYSQDFLHLEQLEIDLNSRRVRVLDRTVVLSKKEMDLLWQLALNSGRVLTREYLIDNVWGFYDLSDTRTVDTHIKKLRGLLVSLDAPWEINTVCKVGFKLCLKETKILPAFPA